MFTPQSHLGGCKWALQLTPGVTVLPVSRTSCDNRLLPGLGSEGLEWWVKEFLDWRPGHVGVVTNRQVFGQHLMVVPLRHTFA
mmetsp:Transcript_135355/g.270106  ORF Transcript_135355/g.270106 Transcript_135355/m.270106 type:complete len:83 (-) Transcript_135355:136-384(-)